LLEVAEDARWYLRCIRDNIVIEEESEKMVEMLDDAIAKAKGRA
jgi:hypothetical protein